MDKKIKIGFNDKMFLERTKELQVNERKATQCLKFIEQITGLKTLITIEDISNTITSKTGFVNVEASAELLNLSEAFYYLKTNLDTVKWEDLELGADDVKTKKTVLDDLTMICTSYLDEQFIQEYETLEKACDILNKLKRETSTRFLDRNYNGIYSVNLQGLQNSNFI